MAALLSVVILLIYVVVKCIVMAVPIDPNKIDFEKVNRDMRKPKFPFEPDFRQKPAQISQAHEVLRLALRSFLDLKDTNLSFYLDEMRKTNESYLDEFGNEIKGYRTIFTLVLKQVDEVENNNYAMNHFEGDKYDLCSISKYLSHQRTFSDRQNIMSKMGEALGSECDPSMPYKRKLYGNPASAAVKNQEPEKQLPNSNNATSEAVSSHFPAETSSEDFEDYIDDEEYLAKLCNHQSLDVYIRNSNTKEFLYAAADYIALDTLRRRVFTWGDLNDIPEGDGNAWTGEETWRIEPVDKYSSNSFRVKNIRDIYGPMEYLFANSPDSVYVRRGLPDNKDSAVLTLGSSAKWQLLAKVAGELRGDLCNLEKSDIRGFVLRNEKYALGFLNAEEDDAFGPPDDKYDRRRRITRLSLENPSYWDILPISTYLPVYPPVSPKILKDGQNGASKKWGMNNYTFILLVTTLIYQMLK